MVAVLAYSPTTSLAGTLYDMRPLRNFAEVFDGKGILQRAEMKE